MGQTHRRTTMYLTKKDRKIQTQQKIIARLEEENECLKEQLTQNDPKHISGQMSLMKQAHDEYVHLVDELNGLKDEYQKLIMQMGKDKIRLKRNCR